MQEWAMSLSLQSSHLGSRRPQSGKSSWTYTGQFISEGFHTRWSRYRMTTSIHHLPSANYLGQPRTGKGALWSWAKHVRTAWIHSYTVPVVKDQLWAESPYEQSQSYGHKPPTIYYRYQRYGRRIFQVTLTLCVRYRSPSREASNTR